MLPKELEDARYVQTHLIGDLIGYRGKDGLNTFVPDEYPVRSIILVVDEHGSVTSTWTQSIRPGISHSKHYEWIDLGEGIMPKKPYGLRRAAFDLALGYLSGFPMRDVLRFVWNFSFSEKRAEKVMMRDA